MKGKGLEWGGVCGVALGWICLKGGGLGRVCFERFGIGETEVERVGTEQVVERGSVEEEEKDVVDWLVVEGGNIE